jgi:hypothetical protein
MGLISAYTIETVQILFGGVGEIGGFHRLLYQCGGRHMLLLLLLCLGRMYHRTHARTALSTYIDCGDGENELLQCLLCRPQGREPHIQIRAER